MRSDARLARVLRALQLPLEYEPEGCAEEAAADALANMGVSRSEQATALEEDTKNWEDHGKCPDRLARVIDSILERCAGSVIGVLPGWYVKTHQKLVQHGEISARSARHLLSSARLAAHLIDREQMSCAQAARVLSAPLGENTYTWQQIQTLCAELGIPVPEMTNSIVERLYRADSEEQTSRFADSTHEVEREQLTRHATELGFNADPEDVLDRFMRSDFDPAMRIISHYMLTVSEFYDHPPSITYEFKPRGQASTFLQDKHPTYSASGSAILNVAKGVPSLDDNWAWGRKRGRRSDALTLSALFRGLERMPYPARREFASWLRQWIVRTYERDRVEPVPLDSLESGDEALRFIEALTVSETHTSGVVEQRLVDALTGVSHSDEDWLPRGLSDSVNAANLPRRKMGDCEYRHRKDAAICAYEATAGRLTIAYVQGHQRSLERVIEQRTGDLEAHANPSYWDISVTFVAHEPGGSDFQSVNLCGYQVRTDAITYRDLLEQVRRMNPAEDLLVAKTNALLIAPLNSASVPQTTRDRVNEICQQHSN